MCFGRRGGDGRLARGRESRVREDDASKRAVVVGWGRRGVCSARRVLGQLHACSGDRLLARHPLTRSHAHGGRPAGVPRGRGRGVCLHRSVGAGVRARGCVCCDRTGLVDSSSDQPLLVAMQQAAQGYVTCLAPAVVTMPWPEEFVQIGNRVLWARGASSVQVTLPSALPDGSAYCFLSIAGMRVGGGAGDLIVADAASMPARRVAPADGIAGVEFALAGRTLTITSRNRRLLRLVSGQQIVARCSAGERTAAAVTRPAQALATTLRPRTRAYGHAEPASSRSRCRSTSQRASMTASWTRSTRRCSRSYRSTRRPWSWRGSRRRAARGLVLLSFGTGADARHQLRFAYKDAEALLARAHRALSAAALVAAIAQREAAQRVSHVVLLARTINDVTLSDAVYVVASGTHNGRFELASLSTSTLARYVFAGTDPSRDARARRSRARTTTPRGEHATDFLHPGSKSDAGFRQPARRRDR